MVSQPFAQGLGVRVALQMTGRTVIRTTRAARLQLHLCCCKLPQACSDWKSMSRCRETDSVHREVTRSPSGTVPAGIELLGRQILRASSKHLCAPSTAVNTHKGQGQTCRDGGSGRRRP